MVGCCIICQWRNEFEPRRMFHKFPTDLKERRAWLKAIGKTIVKKFAKICSLHFRRSCYMSRMNGQMCLKPGSVPTLHLKIPTRNQDESNIEPKTDAARKLSCDDCKRNFLNVTALKSHLHHVHKKTMPTKQQANTNIVKRRNIAKKSTTKMPDTVLTESKGAQVSKLGKHIFECPLCERHFSIYFTAFQHIQKFHCVNKNGEKVSPLSQDIVKPIRIEECICDQMIRSDKPHICPLKPEPVENKYFCLGCEQIFDNLSLFQVHLKGLHGDDVEVYFFPKRSEFTAWKTLLQNETQTNYIKLIDTSVYHCSHQPLLASSNLTQLCPSTITIKQIPNGYHMTFYKTHVGHECDEYTIPEAHKNNCITTFFKETDDIDIGSEEDDKDLYLQFKKVMNSIVLDAAKINITTLQTLLSKAFEMTTILNSYDEDAEDDGNGKKLNDDQISSLLEDITLKRKTEPLQQDAKKVKCDNNGDVKAESPVAPVKVLQSPPSFNDSYKTFVDQNFKSQETSKERRKKEIVKTKIGQFNKLKTATPKAEPLKSGMYENSMPRISKVWTVKPDVKYEVKEQDNDCNILILKI